MPPVFDPDSRPRLATDTGDAGGSVLVQIHNHLRAELDQMHHTIEDQSMFTELRRTDASLAPVLDPLSEEHEVIAELLDELDRALVAMVGPAPSDGDAETARTAVERMAEILLSHLTYEEEELVGPLARLGILV